MYISSPLSYPISLLLDVILGTHTKSRFQNNDLVALIELHTHNALKKIAEDSNQEHDENSLFNNEIGLDEAQASLMISAIEIAKKKAIEKMIPLQKVFMFDHNLHIDDPIEIKKGGFSRIPIYEGDRNNVIGKYFLN